MNINTLRYFLKVLRTTNYFFIINFIVVFFILKETLPSLYNNSEIWAEAGTNFFLTAKYQSLWTNIWTTDYGYLPWLQRIISIIIIKLFKIEDNFPTVFQTIALLFICFYSSYINIRHFRTLIRSDLIRFMIGLSIGLGIFSSYDEFAFINFVYYGVFFLALTFFYNKDQLSIHKFTGIIILSILVASSKPYFIVFFPLSIFFLVFNFLTGKNKREYIYHSLLIFFMLFQVGFMFWNRTITQSAQSAYTILDIISNLTYYYSSSVIQVLPTFNETFQYIFLFLYFIAIFYLLLYQKKYKLFLFCNYSAVFTNGAKTK